MSQALSGIRVVDAAGVISTAYCAKLFADYGAEVINLEPATGFSTRRAAPFLPETNDSAMHAYLHTNKRSVDASALDGAGRSALIASADLVLDTDEVSIPEVDAANGVRCTISWLGQGPHADWRVGEGQIFAMNGMVRVIGRPEGPPLIPTGVQAQVIGGTVAFIGAMTHVLGRELGNLSDPVHLETSIFEACLCFSDVHAVTAHNTDIEAPRMGINHYPPTYPIGVFPCRDGWIGVTALTPSQWHSFCALIGMDDFADVELFQTTHGRLISLDVIEPVMSECLTHFSVNELLSRGQGARIPLAHVPTMDELLGVDQFVERRAFSEAMLSSGAQVTVPSVPFRLFSTPPHFGGPVAQLGQHNAEFV